MPQPQDKHQQTQTQQNEGEGNKTAARRYNEGVERTVKSGEVDRLAREAEEALDGEEGDELREADEEGRRRGDEKR